MTKEDILVKHWERHAPTTSLDTSFVDDVIYPAMEEYANFKKPRSIKLNLDQEGYDKFKEITERDLKKKKGEVG